VDNLIISLGSNARSDFSRQEASEDGVLPIAAGLLDGFNHYSPVSRILEGVKLDNRVASRVSCVKGNVTTGERALDSGDGETKSIH
jgi:hypothetical protein